MSDVAVEVDQVWKKFHRGEFHDSLRDAVPALFRRVWGRGPNRRELGEGDFWALRDVSFQVRHGEVLGIIGANGAGKSTLLKILARILKPNRGYVQVHGRLRALIEIAAGFHGDLTGRENIYLNGCILGMKKREIDAKFDQIVDFSGIEPFLDTPVKRYSSGMYARLGFAVAAHLDPEILVVDEVLAVGDSAFQAKCLGRMTEVAGEGRTVLFVSHNMAAVDALCSRAACLEGGRLKRIGPSSEVIAAYQQESFRQRSLPLGERTDRRGSGKVRFTSIRIVGMAPEGKETAPVCGNPMRVELEYEARVPHELKKMNVAILFLDGMGTRLFCCDTVFQNADFIDPPPRGKIQCDLPALPLAAGEYQLSLWAAVGKEPADVVPAAARFVVGEGNFFGSGRVTIKNRHGPFLVRHDWSLAGGSTEPRDG